MDIEIEEEYKCQDQLPLKETIPYFKKKYEDTEIY